MIHDISSTAVKEDIEPACVSNNDEVFKSHSHACSGFECNRISTRHAVLLANLSWIQLAARKDAPGLEFWLDYMVRSRVTCPPNRSQGRPRGGRGTMGGNSGGWVTGGTRRMGRVNLRPSSRRHFHQLFCRCCNNLIQATGLKRPQSRVNDPAPLFFVYTPSTKTSHVV